MTRKYLSVICACLVLATLHGCAPVIVAGAATGVSVANDRRTGGTILEDQSIEFKAAGVILGDKSLAKDAHINITSFNNVVLLTGQAPNMKLARHAAQLVKNVDKIKRIHNEIEIGKPTELKTRSSDTWITTKVKSTLLGAKGLGSVHVKVITENGTVYLMGLVTRSEGNAVATTVQQVKNVQRVVKVFEYLD